MFHSNLSIQHDAALHFEISRKDHSYKGKIVEDRIVTMPKKKNQYRVSKNVCGRGFLTFSHIIMLEVAGEEVT